MNKYKTHVVEVCLKAWRGTDSLFDRTTQLVFRCIKSGNKPSESSCVGPKMKAGGGHQRPGEGGGSLFSGSLWRKPGWWTVWSVLFSFKELWPSCHQICWFNVCRYGTTTYTMIFKVSFYKLRLFYFLTQTHLDGERGTDQVVGIWSLHHILKVTLMKSGHLTCRIDVLQIC